MGDLNYGPFEVREDIRAAHGALWKHLAAPGTWWTGPERIACAAEARRADDCEVCAARKKAISASAVQVRHEASRGLSPTVVDVIHRVRTDPARLSRAWFDAVVAAELKVPAYVELVGIVTMVTGIDYFARALGVSLFPLPSPEDGQPSRRLPASAKGGVAWVPMIDPGDTTGSERDLYPRDPMVPNIVRALSVVPAEVRMLQVMAAAHYLPVAQISDPTARRSIDRMQMELVAARVSALNQCFY